MRILCSTIMGAAILFTPLASRCAEAPKGLQNGANSAAAAPVDLSQAEKDLAAGRVPQALEELQHLEADSTKSAVLEHQLALAYYKSGRMMEASSHFAQALGLDPDDREAVQLSGLALYRAGHTAEAIPLLEKVRQWVPAGTTDADYILGLCLIDAARYEDARRSFARQYQLGADSAAAYLIAGQLFLRAHLAPAAIEAGHRALTLDPHLPLTHYLLGEAALYQENLTEALQQFEAEQVLNPGYAALYDRLADAYIRQGHYDEAQAALNRAIILDPARTGPYILLGKVMLKRGDAPSAEMYLRRANKMDPNNYMSHALLGQALRTLGRSEDSSRELKIAVDLQSDTQVKTDAPR